MAARYKVSNSISIENKSMNVKFLTGSPLFTFKGLY